MPNALDIFQQVFCLSMKVCSAAKLSGDVGSLAQALGNNLTQLYGNAEFASGDTWSTCWGPVVWQAPYSQVADQAVAVCFNETQKVYVVAIAATNPRSSFDVFYEDLAVSSAYMQAIGAAPGHTSAGNHVALQAILGMTDKGASLQSFLSGVATSDANVVFCGHSLGGGLVPLLAASLYPGGTQSSGWKNVYTYGSAGPTTADSTFATAFNTAFPVIRDASGSAYAVWNSNLYNARDIVPNAWAPGSSLAPGLSNITATPPPFLKDQPDKMFYTGSAYTTVVVALRKMAQALVASKTSTGSTNPYASVNYTLFFMGERKNGQITQANPKLGDEMLYQHIDAYIENFGVDQVIPPIEMQGAIRPPLLPLALSLSEAYTNETDMPIPDGLPEEQ